MTDLCSINSRTYWHSVNTIHLLTHAGVSSSSPRIPPCQCWVSAGEAPPSPSCWGFPNTGRFPENTAEWILTESSHELVLCVCVCVSCVCSGLTKQDFCLFTSPVCFKCLWGLVWLLFGWGSCFLWFRLQLQKNTANRAASTTRACVTGTSAMCTHMFSFEVFRWKLWKPALEVQRQMWLHSWMEAFHLETQNSAAPWWLKEELQLRAQWIHPLFSLIAIVIGWIGRCRLMVSWPISSKHYHIEDENKFCSGAVNLLSIKCDLVFSTTYLLLIIILTPLSYIK